MAEAKDQKDSELFLLEAWVADNPGSLLFLKLAKAYRAAERLDEAAQVLQKGLVMHPNLIQARGLLASILEDTGDSEGALAQYMAAANEIAAHAEVFKNLGELLENQGSDAQASKALVVYEALAHGFMDKETAKTGPKTMSTAEIQAARGRLKEAARVYKEMQTEESETAEKPEAKPAGQDIYQKGLLDSLDALKNAARKRAGV
jgi:tetratricopeptide (TPR) repeat protein